MLRITEANAKPSAHPRRGIMACAEPNAAPMRNAPARVAEARAAAPWLSDAAKASIESASATRIRVVTADRHEVAILDHLNVYATARLLQTSMALDQVP